MWTAAMFTREATVMAKKSKTGAVRLIADGTNTVSLVFPRQAKLTGKMSLSQKEVVSLLTGGGKAGVSGQDAGCCGYCGTVGGCSVLCFSVSRGSGCGCQCSAVYGH
jgi:hypothetical protein